MLFLRSLLFNILFIAWTALVSITAFPALILPPWTAHRVARLWNIGTIFLLKWVVGMTYDIRGRENVPADGRYIVAAKHQSAWETLVLHFLLHEPVFVLKIELLRIPFVGWLMAKAGNIGVDRAKGASALRYMIDKAKERLDQGRPIIIFPEGTRTPPGTTQKLHPGVAMLYENTDAPVIPVALNSGLYWRRNAFIKRPGTVLVQFMPPMPRDLKKRDFLNDLHARLNAETDKLIEEAGGLPEDLRLQNQADSAPVDNGDN